jgi:glucose/mannose-6-phosphate isomerase
MSDMLKLVENFPAQLREALDIGSKTKLEPAKNEIRNIVITGLGGSGIGATIIAEIVANECPVPISVNKDYFMPAFVNSNTLVIVCSYSGNTEETIQALEAAMSKNAMIACISSGGKVVEIAKQKNYNLIVIPPGMPPRACLGYSLIQLFYLLNHYKFIKNDFVSQTESAINLFKSENTEIITDAQKITDHLSGKLPVIYAVDGYNGVATRFRQQLNENSKILCWHNILPEMNHNELVGWASEYKNIAVIILRNNTDYSRTQTRLEISKKVFKKYNAAVMELWSKGNSHLERALYLIHVTDFVSVQLADKRKIDAMEVNIIDHLKGELAKI